MKAPRLILHLATLLGVAFTADMHAQTTTFTYQGFLTELGAPANGPTDFEFKLYNDPNAGTQQGGTVTKGDVGVTNGLFTLSLDFTATPFDGSALWLDIAVRPGASAGGYTNLVSRQPITAMPYAIKAGNAMTMAMGTISDPNFFGTTDNQPLEFYANNEVVLRLENPTVGTSPNLFGGSAANSIATNAQGAVIGGGGSAAFPNLIDTLAHFSVIGGGASNSILGGSQLSTISGGGNNWIDPMAPNGTISGGQQNSIGENAQIGVVAGGFHNQIWPESDYGVIGGGWWNAITNDADYAAISGGYYNTVSGGGATIGGGFGNTASGSWSTIGGGQGNLADGVHSTVAGGRNNETLSVYATVGGGQNNSAAGFQSTVAGGDGNSATDTGASVGGGINNTTSGFYAVVAGGEGNEAAFTHAVVAGGQRNSASNNWSAVGGGVDNTSSGAYSTTGGGQLNSATGTHSVVSGGDTNRATGEWSAVLGGWDNEASGYFTTVVGGSHNLAIGQNSIAMGQRSTAGGNFSVAMGTQAKANHEGTFVWADNLGGPFSSSTTHQFLVRAANGIGLGSSNTVFGFVEIQQPSDDITHGLAVANVSRGRSLRLWVDGSDRSRIDSGPSGNANLIVNAGGGNVGIGNVSPAEALDVVGNIVATGTITGSSDRNRKENFAAVDPQEVLERVSRMPIHRWNYIGEGTTHIGPVAQDFYSAFQVGMDDKHISMVDADGVALAAVQGLNQKLEQPRAELKRRDAENADLKQRMARLEHLFLKFAEKAE